MGLYTFIVWIFFANLRHFHQNGGELIGMISLTSAERYKRVKVEPQRNLHYISMESFIHQEN